MISFSSFNYIIVTDGCWKFQSNLSAKSERWGDLKILLYTSLKTIWLDFIFQEKEMWTSLKSIDSTVFSLLSLCSGVSSDELIAKVAGCWNFTFLGTFTCQCHRKMYCPDYKVMSFSHPEISCSQIDISIMIMNLQNGAISV